MASDDDEITRALSAWTRIERWLEERLPAALENFGAPASQEQLADLEATIGRPLPPSLRVILEQRDGEAGGWLPSAFPDGHSLLPCAQIAEMWEQLVSLAEEMGDTEDAYDFWKAQVDDGIISIQGPVKPNFGSRRWIPISTLEGAVQRFIDFDPAPGGREGQVIEVDAEACMHRVLAPSFPAFLESHADALERGELTVADDGLRSDEAAASDPTTWGPPAYLAETTDEPAPPDAGATPPRPAPTGGAADEASDGAEEQATDESGTEATDGAEEVTIEGTMGVLLGGPETIFSLQTDAGEEFLFLAKANLTRGYRTIAVQQRARVRARPYTADVGSVFVDQMGSEAPDYVALEYRMIRTRDG